MTTLNTPEKTAFFAEEILSTGYREAWTADVIQSPEDFPEHRVAAQALLAEVLHTPRRQAPADTDFGWEVSRRAALAEMDGAQFGAFKNYLHGVEGLSRPSVLAPEDLEVVKPEIAQTNRGVIDLNRQEKDPIDFLDQAVANLDSIRRRFPDRVGSGNYATAVKFFADKVALIRKNYPNVRFNQEDMQQVVDSCMNGFITAANRGKPNFVEMTNVYSAINFLPADSFRPEHSKSLVRLSMQMLPTYHKRTLRMLMSSLAKLDISQAPHEAATLVDLTMRKMRFEKTDDMRLGLRVLTNMVGGTEAERAFKTFLKVRNNLEKSMDHEGATEVSDRLLYIVENVIRDPESTQAAGHIAWVCAQIASRHYSISKADGKLSPEQMALLGATTKRVINNARGIGSTIK